MKFTGQSSHLARFCPLPRAANMGLMYHSQPRSGAIAAQRPERRQPEPGRQEHLISACIVRCLSASKKYVGAAAYAPFANQLVARLFTKSTDPIYHGADCEGPSFLI